MSKPVSVTFAKAWRGYSKGEVAGFDKATAEALVEGGFATSKAVATPARGRAAEKKDEDEPKQPAAPADSKSDADEAKP